MSKALKNSNLARRRATRALVAVSLSLSLAAFGCTTDRNLGNGDPVVTPGLRTSPVGGTSTGTESAPSVPTYPQSMISSSSFDNGSALPPVQVRGRLSAAQAAAVMAQHQPRERYLGVAYPGTTGRGYYSEGLVTGQFQNPALRTNPQSTVNSSLSSGPTAVIASGAGDAGSADSALLAGAIVGGTDIGTGTGITAGSTVTGTTGTGTTSLGTTSVGTVTPDSAPIFFSPTTTAGPATTLPTGTLAATVTPTTTPAAFSAIAPSALVSTSPALAAAATSRTPATNLSGTVAATNSDNATVNTELNNNGTTANLTSGATAATNAITNTTATATTAGTTARTTLGAGRVRATGTVTGTNGATTAATPSSATTNSVRATRDANGRIVITNSAARQQ